MLLTQALLLTTLTAAAPSSEAVKSVFDHFYHGQGQGLVLGQAELCKKIEKADKERRNDCVESFGASAAKGDLVNVYLVGVVPKGDKAELMIQASHEGIVRTTKDVTLEGKYIRARTWRGFKLTKPGKWEFKVIEGSKVLQTMAITAE